ncbi:MAG: hypothetical protein HXY36_02830 [Chloroflexi bacterium]|nr:hypothetical protein [Chloroflexota bacterium]
MSRMWDQDVQNREIAGVTANISGVRVTERLGILYKGIQPFIVDYA